MKRKSNLYNEIVSYDRALEMFNIIKNNYKRKDNLYLFSKYLNCYLIEIVNLLKDNKYVWGKYHIFLINDPKYRIIMAESLPDKIVNHLVCKYILLPVIEPCLIDTNVATRENRGSSYAFSKIVKFFYKFDLNKEVYVLKIDISKYFYNIDHDILMGMLERKIKDKKAMDIIRNIIDTTNREYVNNCINQLRYREIDRVKGLNISLREKEKKILELEKIPTYSYKKGLPIGNMTSQTLAIFYLNEVDYFIKEVLKFKYYIRYMDDLVIIDSDKNRLKESYFRIVNKIREYKLDVNAKYNIYRLSKGINFLGYNFKSNKGKLLIRYNNMTIRRINRSLKKKVNSDFELYLRSINSYKGYFIRCNTGLYWNRYKLLDNRDILDKYNFIKNYFNDFVVFIRYKKFYYCFDRDILIFFGFNMKKFKVNDDKMVFVRGVLDSYNIKYIIYNGNDFNRYNDGGNVFVMEKDMGIVFRKNGDFYRCYGDDALIMSYLFGYKIVNDCVSFSKKTIDRVIARLDNYMIDYYFRDYMDIISNRVFDNNRYSDYLEKGRDRYDKVCLIKEISDILIDFNYKDIMIVRDMIRGTKNN